MLYSRRKAACKGGVWRLEMGVRSAEMGVGVNLRHNEPGSSAFLAYKVGKSVY